MINEQVTKFQDFNTRSRILNPIPGGCILYTLAGEGAKLPYIVK